MSTPIDKIGQPILIGSYIAYGHALGRCAALRVGKVLSIKDYDAEGVDRPLYRYGGGSGFAFTVIGINDDWQHHSPELCSRKGTLMFPNRLLVLASSSVPATYRSLLDNYPSVKKNLS